MECTAPTGAVGPATKKDGALRLSRGGSDCNQEGFRGSGAEALRGSLMEI